MQRSTYGDIGIIFSDFDGANALTLGGQLGIPLGQSFELGVTLEYLTIDPEFGDNISGLTDPLIIGRYQVQKGRTDISVGGGLTLPIGEEEIGGGESVDINIFGALRHLVNTQLSVAGVLGIDFIEDPFNDEYDASLHLGVAVIYRTSPDMQIIGELDMLSESDFALLSFGIDYSLNNSTSLRPALGLGLDDGAPDFVFAARILFQ